VSFCSEHYLIKPGSDNFFLLRHSTGHKPKGYEIDVPIVYTDYGRVALRELPKAFEKKTFD
jgi:hypothetical protein